ncbi:MAG: energy-coupled thiamine transporter ThiT [Oscillospiraceae bacterium]|nr:energy-coupled thiamine transporter ThiT [Oscillospiraceae bacterium]
MNNTVKRLTTGAMLVALSALLSMLVIYRLPYGGSVTAFSMLPVCVFAYKYGLKWGLLGGLAFSLTRILLGSLGGAAFASMDLLDLTLMLFLDYIAAYTFLGLAAVTRGKLKSERSGLVWGIVIACAARLLAHSLSGYILFRQYAEWFFSQEGFTFGAWVLDNLGGQGLMIFYSVFYNAMFLVPETLITVAAGAILMSALGKRILAD